MKTIPSLSNGLTVAFDSLDYSRGALWSYVVTLGHTLTLSTMELYEFAPALEREVGEMAREIAAIEAADDAREMAELREWCALHR